MTASPGAAAAEDEDGAATADGGLTLTVDVDADDEPEAPLLEVDRWTGGAIGRYEVLAELGAGGMASVYLARLSGAQGVRRFFAIKRIHPHLARDRRFVEMFVDEARLASALQHHNVSQMFELGSDGRTEFLVMEYLHGEHFMKVMSRAFHVRTPLTWTVAAHVVAEAAAGLHHAHEARDEGGAPLELVHRDVTPHNVFVTYEGGVKITDFGIAKARNRLTQTQTGSLKGKLAYMSPEQADRREVDRRTDVFALGIILYEATTGRRLFKAPTEVQTIMRVTSCKVPPPQTILPEYPEELARIVYRALSRRPADRYPTADAMAADLRAFISTQPDGSQAPTELRTLMESLFENDRLKKEEWLRSEPTRAPAPSVERASVTKVGTAEAVTARTSARAPWALAALALVVLSLATFVAVLLRPRETSPQTAPIAATPVVESVPVRRDGVVRLDSIPLGAAIVVDGIPRGTTPALLESVPLGSHQVSWMLEGHQTVERTIDVSGARTDVSVNLEPVPTVPNEPRSVEPRGSREGREEEAEGTVTMSLVTLPWARVWINGEPAGETPFYNRSLPAGRIVVRLQREGVGPTRTFTFRGSPGATLRERIEL